MDQQNQQRTEQTPEGPTLLVPKREDFFAKLERASLRPLGKPYLEVETRSIPSIERAIVGELAQATLATKRTRRNGG